MESPEYRAWKDARARCYQEHNRRYASYGGRGISMCEAWRQDYRAFLNDMGPRPSNEHSLDRIDNNGPYSPDNCRWATRVQQQRNRLNNRILELNGERRTVAEWSERTGMPRVAIMSRLNRGWPIERVLGEPLKKRQKNRTIEWRGQSYSIRELANLLMTPYHTLKSRFDRGWSGEQILDALARAGY